MQKGKRKSVTFDTEARTKKQRKSQQSDETPHDDHDTGEDAFMKKIHARPINERYLLLHKLGEGGFGVVYLGRDIVDEKEVALKLEHRSREPSILEDEASRYKELQDIKGFPEIYWYGWHDDFKVMAFELLGPSLEDMFAFCGHEFSLSTTLMVLDQFLQRLEVLHSRGLLHRDIKPQNCLLGNGSNGNVIYITDFGLVEEAGSDDECTLKSRMVGTARYASIRGHEGRAQSFKDDLESLGYMAIYFVKGRLPWQGLKGRGKEKEAAVVEKKKSISVEELCAGLPEEFVEYMAYVDQLQHGEIPKYAQMRRLFRQRATVEGIKYNDVFDWTELMYLHGAETLC